MMFKLTFFRASELRQPTPRCPFPMLRHFTTPSEETATIIAGALMRKGYCVRLWGRRDQLIF
jgi:hypothetical protein